MLRLLPLMMWQGTRIFEGSPVAMKAEHLADLRYNYVESLAETLVFALLKFLPWTAV